MSEDDELPLAVDLSGVSVPPGCRRARLWCMKEHHEHDVWVPEHRGPMIGESEDTRPTAEAMRAQAPEIEPGVWQCQVIEEHTSDAGRRTRTYQLEIEVLRWCDDCTTWRVRMSPAGPGQMGASCGWKILELSQQLDVMERVR